MCLLLVALVFAEIVAPEDLGQISKQTLEEIFNKQIDCDLNCCFGLNR